MSKGTLSRLASSGRGGARLLLLATLVTLAAGCASYGVVHNQPEHDAQSGTPYSVRTWADSKRASDFVFVLAFSGGGTRAAAIAYGVMKALRDTPVVIDGKQGRLLDEVTHISSVSGGSFTAAYYGLYGDALFERFEDDFLRRNVESHLTAGLFDPAHWFSRKGRSERAAEYYDKILFHGATFTDMIRPDGPMIVINASDLAWGLRFSFIQDYFDFLCSDLRDFPVASAVTASSAVPVVFNPVVVENFSGCPTPAFPAGVAEQAEQSRELAQTLDGLRSYSDKDNRRYIHFVDGGITDNMGLRAMADVVAISGGPRNLISHMHRKVPKRIVFLSVNASTEHRPEMDKTPKQPSMSEAMSATTDVQLLRYNEATIDSVKNDLAAWTAELSTPEQPIESYFIEVSFSAETEQRLRVFLNSIPTSFDLNDEQVDALIASGGKLLQADAEFQRLMRDLQ